MDTFGNKTIKVQFGNNTYHHNVILASVSEPIIGFDFLIKHQLDFKWSRDGTSCFLNDPRARNGQGQSVPLKWDAFKKENINLAVLTFKKFAQEKSELASKAARPYQIPADYKQLVEKFPEILDIKVLKNPSMGSSMKYVQAPISPVRQDPAHYSPELKRPRK